MDKLEIHRIEINKDGKWEEVHFNKICPGDSFRMYHPNGTQFIDSNNEHVLYATSEPFYDEELDAWLVHIK
ncbi:hypothetical protein KIS4809_2330 [Bacillus sp. ZZV12-4809]|nr:hypothetical protein KIS4809_2330 [Bacillus sp. ZZV12-4809]